MIQIFARELLYTRPVMASLIKTMFGSSSNRSDNQFFDPNLTPRVRPHTHDPTLAWEKLKVKQIVKRLVLRFLYYLLVRTFVLYCAAYWRRLG